MSNSLYFLLNPLALGMFPVLIVCLVLGGKTHRPIKLRRVLLWVALGFLILTVIYTLVMLAVCVMEWTFDIAILVLPVLNVAGGWWWRRAFRRLRQPVTAPPPPRVSRKPIFGIASLCAIPACTVVGCLFMMCLAMTGHINGENPNEAMGGIMVLMMFAGGGSVPGLVLAIVAAARREGWWGVYVAGFVLNSWVVLVMLLN